MKIHIDNQSYTTKPQKQEIAIISKRIADSIYETDNLYEIVKRISRKGHTWCPAIFNGTRSINNFISTQLIALDFDDGVIFDDVKKKAEKYMIPIFFAYETFSSININKFRVIFKLDKVITDVNEFNFIMSVFMKIFTGCDTACKDVSRMFFGGKRLLYYDRCDVETDILMMNFELYLKDTYGNTHYKSQFEKFVKNQGYDGKTSPLSVYNKTTNGEKLPNHKKYRKNTLTAISESCRLYREFTQDSKWLFYPQLYGLITNLIHIETGEKTFLEHIENSKFDTYKKDWKFYVNYFKKNNYSPTYCEKFCPYCDTCHHSKTILETASVKRKNVARINTPEYRSIEEVQKELFHHFYTAAESDDNKIHVIKAQTAIGKTHLYINYLKNTDERCIIAVPTNKLKKEVYDACTEAGIDVMMTPSIQEIREDIPDEIYRRISNMYNAGKHSNAKKYINSLKEDVPALDTFLKESAAVKKFDSHIITTHHHVLYSRKKHLKKYNLIIDEDILKTIVKNQISVKIEDIESIIDTDLSYDIKNHLNKIIAMSKEKGLFSVIPLDECNMSVNFNLEALVKAEKFYSDGESVIFYHTPKLKKLKYIILSATADEYIYKSYFGNKRVVFYTCETAKYKGNLVQYINHSYSRRFIENAENVYDNIADITGNIPMITFKKFSDDEYGIHFGNSEGCNCMKGQDIAVVGTPHMADFLYKLMAYQIGYNAINDTLFYRQVEHNGFKFWFYSYKNELMQRIQFWMIESELEQSVGRARLLRENCTVYLFSDFPLQQSIIKTNNICA